MIFSYALLTLSKRRVLSLLTRRRSGLPVLRLRVLKLQSFKSQMASLKPQVVVLNPKPARPKPQL